MESLNKMDTDEQCQSILEGYLRINGITIPITAKQVEAFENVKVKTPPIPKHMKDAGALLERGLVSYKKNNENKQNRVSDLLWEKSERADQQTVVNYARPQMYSSTNYSFPMAARNGDFLSEESIKIINDAMDEDDFEG